MFIISAITGRGPGVRGVLTLGSLVVCLWRGAGLRTAVCQGCPSLYSLLSGDGC